MVYLLNESINICPVMKINKNASLTTKLFFLISAVFFADVVIIAFSKSLAVALICLIVSLFLLYMLLNNLVKNRITYILQFSDIISSGDLTQSIEVKGDDELAQLGNSLNMMIVSIRNILLKSRNSMESLSRVSDAMSSASKKIHDGVALQIKAIEKTAEEIGNLNNSIKSISSNTEELSETADNTSASIIEMSTNVDKVAQTSSVFSESTGTTVLSIEEMSATVKEIAESLETLSASAEETSSSLSEISMTVREVEQKADESVKLSEKATSDASEKGMKAIDDVSQGMRNIKESVDAISKAINVLSERSKQIGRMLSVIDEVADQTNLIAINAAILAAKTGEHGRPFTVIADEIKTLSERTSFSTNEIDNLVASIQNETKASVELASAGIHNVEKGMGFVKEAKDVLESILESSNQASDMTKFIQRATVEETRAVRQITVAVKNITQQIEHISKATKEQSRGSQMISDSSEKIREMATFNRKATEEQAIGVKLIADSIENIATVARRIEQSIRNQQEQSSNILFSMNMMKEIADKSSAFFNEMDDALKSFESEASDLSAEVKRFKA